MGVIFELAGQVWKAIGVELVIFTVTICVTWAVRFTSKNVAKQPQKKVAKTLADAATHASEKAAPKAYLPGSWRDAAARAAAGRDMEGRRASEAVQHDTAERQPWQLIDDIFSLMQKAPGQKSTVQALQIYSQLRKQLGLGSDAADEQTAGVDKVISIADATRYAKHSAVDLYSTLVHCAMRAGQCHLVERLVDDMVHQGVTRSAAFYESTMKQLAGQKYYRLALNIYDRLQADGLEPSAVTCSCLISFATELGEHKRALDFFEKLSSKTTPSIRAFMTVLRVHAQQQDWSASLKTLRDMQQRGILLDSLTLNVVLATGVATGNLVEADELLAEADSMTPPAADVVSYNTIIKGFARRGDVKATSRLIARMKGRGLSPNAITYNTTMDAAVRGPKPSEAWQILTDMRQSGLSADKFTCSILMKALSKQPTIEHIQAAMDLLQEAGKDCDSMLRSSLYHGVLDATLQASDDVLLMQVVSRMRQHNIALNDSANRKLRERTARSRGHGVRGLS